MKKRLAHLTVLLLAIFFVLSPRSVEAAEPLSYVQRLSLRAEEWKQEIPILHTSAEAAAKRTLAGGTIYVTGPQIDFAEEMLARAGGLMMNKFYRPKTVLTENDTVLAAFTGIEDQTSLKALAEKAHAAKATVIVFSPLKPDETDVEWLPGHEWKAATARSDLKIDSASNAMGAWVWTGEFVGACVAGGKMPTMFQSGGLPGGTERNAPLRSIQFHDTTNVQPQDAMNLGRTYLDKIAAMLKRVETEDGESFQRAASFVRASHQAGGTVRVVCVSHMFPSETKVPQNPQWISAARPQKVLPQLVADPAKPQDCTIAIWYQEFPTELAEALAPNDSYSIVTSVTPPPDLWRANAHHVYIDPFWPIEDAAVNLPGYDVPILPASGVLQCAIYWQIIEDAR